MDLHLALRNYVSAVIRKRDLVIGKTDQLLNTYVYTQLAQHSELSAKLVKQSLRSST